MRPLEGLAPPPIGAQRYPQKEAIFFQERVFQKCANAEREDGHFHHPCQSSDVVHVPTGLRRTWRKRCIRDSCEGEAVAEGSPLAQPLLTDTPEPDPETQPLSRQPDKVDGLSLSTPTEEGGRRLKESDEENGKEAKESSTRPSLRTLNPRTTLCQNEDEMDPPWFCSTPIQTTEDDAKDDGYEEFRRRLGMELAEPVPCHQRKKGLRSIVRVVVYATPAHDTVLKHCLREKLFEDCEACVIGAPGQRHQDLVAPYRLTQILEHMLQNVSRKNSV